jgi:hypothetical protein
MRQRFGAVVLGVTARRGRRRRLTVDSAYELLVTLFDALSVPMDQTYTMVVGWLLESYPQVKPTAPSVIALLLDHAVTVELERAKRGTDESSVDAALTGAMISLYLRGLLTLKAADPGARCMFSAFKSDEREQVAGDEPLLALTIADAYDELLRRVAASGYLSMPDMRNLMPFQPAEIAAN